MKKILLRALVAFALLLPLPALSAVGTIYIDTGGCQTGSTTKCSGTTDSASASASGAAATITCSGTAGPASAAGCSITGSAGQLASIAVDGSQALFINCATNSNQKIFWINAVDDTLGLVGTTVTPTGCTASSSDWGIGGRMIYASANIEAAVRAGDTIQFNNTPAAKSTAFLTARVSGDNTTGFITVRGKTGVRPVLENTSTGNVFASSSISRWYVTNLELKQGGASGNAIGIVGASNTIFDNIKISDSGGDCISSNNSFAIINSEITGCGGFGINTSAGNNAWTTIVGSYIHGNVGGVKMTSTQPDLYLSRNVIANNSARGLYLNATQTSGYVFIEGNTFYGNTTSNFTSDTSALALMVIRNNIFQSDGTNFNVVFTAGSAEFAGAHAYNVFYISAGSNNVSGLTINGTEVSTNPNLTNPGSGDFTINSSSSAAALGYPGQLLGATGLGYSDAGALQRQITSSGASGQLRPGIGQ